MAKNSELDKTSYLLKAAVEEVNLTGGSGSGGSSSAIPINWREIEDISQSHHFTVRIDGIKVNYDLSDGAFGLFLPVQSIALNYVTFNSMSIPVGIYGNLPLLKTKSVGKITLNLYDNDRDEVEDAIRAWESSCFPNNKYVGYLEDIARGFTYTSYSVKGKKNKVLTTTVIPADNYSVNRGYEENAPKIITLTLIAVGDINYYKG